MRRFHPLFLSAGLAIGFAAVPQAGHAFWQRSHWAACSEAPTEAERVRLNCYIFAPAHDWPPGAYDLAPPGRRGPVVLDRPGFRAVGPYAPLVVK